MAYNVKKINKILITILAILLVIFVALGLLLIKTKKENKIAIKSEKSLATLVERKIWNNFLERNPYLSEINYFNSKDEIDYSDLIYLAISSKEAQEDFIYEEDIAKNELLNTLESYKKSKKVIEEYLAEILNIKEIPYNFIETYIEEDKYLIENEEFIYFTRLKLKEKVYMLMEYKEENGNIVAKIYEYEANNNKQELLNMIETGTTIKNLKPTKKYEIKGKVIKPISEVGEELSEYKLQILSKTEI